MLNLSLSFRFDGLSTLFAVLIATVGTLIAVMAWLLLFIALMKFSST